MANVIEKVLFIEENEGWSYKTAKRRGRGQLLDGIQFQGVQRPTVILI